MTATVSDAESPPAQEPATGGLSSLLKTQRMAHLAEGTLFLHIIEQDRSVIEARVVCS